VLKQYEAGLMVAYEVSTRVNTPKNNDAALIESVQSTVGDSAGGETLSFL
jgi:putative SOS response-associated peptidase YedK